MNQCVFCEQPFGPKGSPTQNTKEHIFRRKTLESLGLLQAGFQVQVLKGEGPPRMVPMVGNTFLASGICQECNSGPFFQDIDNAAEDVKVALAQGKRSVRDLNPNERQALALWTAKATYAAIAMGLSDLTIDRSHFTRFYKDRRMPPNSAVVALPEELYTIPSAPLGTSDANLWVSRGLDSKTIAPGYKRGFRLGQMHVAFIHCTHPLGEVRTLPGNLTEIIAATAPVRRAEIFIRVQEENMPLSSLNVLVSNLSADHRGLMPECRVDGQGSIVFLTSFGALFQWSDPRSRVTNARKVVGI